jgi:hypothetical protein
MISLEKKVRSREEMAKGNNATTRLKGMVEVRLRKDAPGPHGAGDKGA